MYQGAARYSLRIIECYYYISHLMMAADDPLIAETAARPGDANESKRS
jgi:hypothetical protein